MAIRACKTPAEAKRMGRKVRIRDDWGLTKEAIMLDLVRQKFRDPLLARMLIDTGNVYIEETNTWGDTYWGVCDGNGLNKLGNILMQVRNEI